MVEHRAGVTLEAGVPQKNPTELVYFSRTSVREEVHTHPNIFIFTPLARALIISHLSFFLSRPVPLLRRAVEDQQAPPVVVRGPPRVQEGLLSPRVCHH
jgi:hypothetical protein